MLIFNGKILNDLTTVQDGKILDGIVKFNHIEIKNLIKYSNKNEVFLKLILKDKTKKIIAQNNHFFVKPKDLKLTKPNIKIKKISATEIEISTDVLAKDVYLMGDTHFSDNFFDLLPKTSKKVTLSKSLKSVEVMTLWDTMNE